MSKYGNVPTVTDDGRFDSKAELARWQELKLLERAGEISGLRRQVRFALDVNGQHIAVYVADFCYSDPKTGLMTVEDSKGVKTAVYQLKKKLMLAVHGVEILET
jgi:hypothetical protein